MRTDLHTLHPHHEKNATLCTQFTQNHTHCYTRPCKTKKTFYTMITEVHNHYTKLIRNTKKLFTQWLQNYTHYYSSLIRNKKHIFTQRAQIHTHCFNNTVPVKKYDLDNATRTILEKYHTVQHVHISTQIITPLIPWKNNHMYTTCASNGFMHITIFVTPHVLK
jgi:hypothetical protein